MLVVVVCAAVGTFFVAAVLLNVFLWARRFPVEGWKVGMVRFDGVWKVSGQTTGGNSLSLFTGGSASCHVSRGHEAPDESCVSGCGFYAVRTRRAVRLLYRKYVSDGGRWFVGVEPFVFRTAMYGKSMLSFRGVKSAGQAVREVRLPKCMSCGSGDVAWVHTVPSGVVNTTFVSLKDSDAPFVSVSCGACFDEDRYVLQRDFVNAVVELGVAAAADCNFSNRHVREKRVALRKVDGCQERHISYHLSCGCEHQVVRRDGQMVREHTERFVRCRRVTFGFVASGRSSSYLVSKVQMSRAVRVEKFAFEMASSGVAVRFWSGTKVEPEAVSYDEKVVGDAEQFLVGAVTSLSLSEFSLSRLMSALNVLPGWKREVFALWLFAAFREQADCYVTDTGYSNVRVLARQMFGCDIGTLCDVWDVVHGTYPVQQLNSMMREMTPAEQFRFVGSAHVQRVLDGDDMKAK